MAKRPAEYYRVYRKTTKGKKAFYSAMAKYYSRKLKKLLQSQEAICLKKLSEAKKEE